MPDITLYTAATPNGWKVSIALEELGVDYEVKSLSLRDNEQKTDDYLKINPNGRIPAIVDHKNNDFSVFESGAILLYLADRYDPENRLWPKDRDEQSLVTQWLMFQMSGLGPMQGQASHFFRYAPEKIPYGIQRYINETKRLYKVLDDHLNGRQYLIGDKYTICDICTIPWILIHFWSGVGQNLNDFPNLKVWANRVKDRAAVKRGLEIPDKNALPNMVQKAQSPEEAEKLAEESKKWIFPGHEPK